MVSAPARRVQDYLRAVLAVKREAVPAGAFVFYVHPTSAHTYLNYAVPLPDAERGDGRELIAVAHARERQPRLEYIEECFPWVAGALAADGFVLESRLALMACAPERCREPHVEAELRPVAADLVGPMLVVQTMAFGDPPPTRDAVAGWRGDAVVALVDGQVVGAAQFTQVSDGVTEIGGVAVAQAYRRRGLGAALTAAATRAAGEHGAELAVLTPGDDDAGRVYERVGFATAATMIHLIA